MLQILHHPAYYKDGAFLPAPAEGMPTPAEAKKGTMAYGILESHNTSGDMTNLKIKFDAMASHDITYVGIIQTARASGLQQFPLPYVLTNCHNSLCAVGGTINEDDHVFGLSCLLYTSAGHPSGTAGSRGGGSRGKGRGIGRGLKWGCFFQLCNL